MPLCRSVLALSPIDKKLNCFKPFTATPDRIVSLRNRSDSRLHRISGLDRGLRFQPSLDRRRNRSDARFSDDHYSRGVTGTATGGGVSRSQAVTMTVKEV